MISEKLFTAFSNFLTADPMNPLIFIAGFVTILWIAGAYVMMILDEFEVLK